MEKKIAAFFDIDGTIYREGLITEVFKKIIKYELVNNEKWENEVKPAFLKWDKRQGDYDDYLLKMVDIYIDTIKGLKKHHIDYIVSNVINQKGDRVYTFSRERIKWHKERGHIVIAISGSPSELVKEMANKYQMDDFRGTVYNINEDETYSGEIIPMWDAVSKQNAIRELTEKYNIDLDSSFAYGDTSGDFTMFENVGNPYAINPTRELLGKVMECKEIRDKITLIVERKDVTYRMNVDNLDLI